MSADFAARRRAARGSAAAALLWVDTVLDVVHNATRAHLDLLRQDLRFTFRSLTRSPGFTATAVLLAALGVAAPTATFSVAHHVLLRPLPFRQPGRLVELAEDYTRRGGGWNELSPSEYRDWKRLARSFSGMAAYHSQPLTLVGGGEPERLEGVAITADLVPVLDRRPLIGRAFSAADDRDGAPGTVLLGYQLWQQRFGGDPGVLGRKLLLDDAAYEVIGVMPADFCFPRAETQLWVATRFAPDVFGDRTNTYLGVVARLRPGVTLAAARAELGGIAAQLERAYPEMEGVGARVVGLREDRLTRQSRLLLVALCAAAGCVLLIACTNLGSLLLGRALARRQELSLRAALGGARERLLRQLLTESGVLAAAGALLGVATALAAVPLLARLIPNSLPFAVTPRPAPGVLALVTLVTAATAIVFGVLPAARACRGVDAQALRESTRGSIGDRRERVRALLVVVEVTLSVVLLVSCGLLLRALWQVQATDPGFRPEGVLTLRTELPLPRYAKTADRTRFYRQVLAGARALPGVTHAGYTSFLPIVVVGGIWPTRLDGEAPNPLAPRQVSLRFVTPDYFATMGIPLRRGRDVGEADTNERPPIAVVSDSFVRQCWPRGEPLGRRFHIGFGTTVDVAFQVVGVVGDVKVRGLERQSEPQIYLAYQQVDDGGLPWYSPKDLAIRSSSPPAALVPALRRIIAQADPRQPISQLRPLTEIVAGETASRAVQARVLVLFAAVAFVLAAVGLHGLLSFTVGARARELGLRIAVGAGAGEILRLVGGTGARLAGLGVLLGGALACATGWVLRSLLAGVSPWDPVVFAAAMALALAMTVGGSLVPALRALRLDPLRVLRAE